MEFDSSGHYNGKLLDQPLHRVFPEKITVLEADALGRLPPRTRGVLEFVIDDLGHRSAKAQGLGAVITTVRKMLYTDQRLYVHRSDRAINGMLKVGRKNLFIRDYATGKMNEINPLCVLDFYVHESMQRGGIGKQLFEEMLRRERLDPACFGYDRPSPKLIGFLRKHYGLVDFDPQPNNFVVFKAYFTKAASSRAAAPQSRQPSSGRRATDGPGDLGAPGRGGMDGRKGWQSATKGSGAGASNSFFLGGSDGRDRPTGIPEQHRNAQNRPHHQQSENSYTDSGLPSRDPQARRLQDVDDMGPRSRSPQDAPVEVPPAAQHGGVGNWSSKLGALAAAGQEDSLAEFARTRQGTGESQRGYGGGAGGWEREAAQRRGDAFGSKSLQEEASHFIYGARRPASGRRAFAPLPPVPHNPPTGPGREWRNASADGYNGLGATGGGGGGAGGGGVMGAANPWRTANSEIGGWNRQKLGADPDAHAHYLGSAPHHHQQQPLATAAAMQRGYANGGGAESGLARAALQDRRVGNRLW